MYLVTLTTPYIGMHKWTSFSTTNCIVKASTEEEVIEILKEEAPPKDPEVQKALQEQDSYRKDEYFTAYLYRIPEDRKCVFIPDTLPPSEADSKIKF